MFQPTDAATSGLLRALQATQHRLERTAVRLATGRRIASASDDPAGIGVAMRLHAGAVSATSADRNYAAGQDLARTAEGALQSTHDTLARMRELSIQARNGTLAVADRAALQQEYSDLASSLDQFAPGAGTTTVTDGEGGDVAVQVVDAGAVALGVAGLDVAAQGTVGAVDAAIDSVASARGALGASDTELGHRRGIVQEMQSLLEEIQSRIADADYATELSALQRDRVLQGLQIIGLRKVGDVQRASLDVLG